MALGQGGPQIGDFNPRTRGYTSLIDLLGQSGQVNRGILQQAAEEQNHAIEHGWDQVGQAIRDVPENYYKGQANERANRGEGREDKRLQMLSEEHGWQGEKNTREGESHKQDLLRGEKEIEGLGTTNAIHKIDMENASRKQKTGAAVNPKTGLSLAEESDQAELAQPGLANRSTEASIRASDAASKAASLSAQLTQVNLGVAQRQAVLDSLSGQLAAARGAGDKQLEDQIMAGINSNPDLTPGIRAQIQNTAIDKVAQSKSSRNLAETSNANVNTNLQQGTDLTQKVAGLRSLVGHVQQFKNTKQASDAETEARHNVEADLTGLGKKDAAGRLSDNAILRVSSEGLGNSTVMDNIVRETMGELQTRINALKQQNAAAPSQQGQQQIQVLEQQMAEINGLIGPGAGAGGNRGAAGANFLNGGGPPGAPQGPRTMRQGGGNIQPVQAPPPAAMPPPPAGATQVTPPSEWRPRI